MTRDEILDKIRKVQALALRGEGGEKISAEKRLNEMMTKYGIRLEDLDENKEMVFWYRAKGKEWKTIFKQTSAIMGCMRFRCLDPDDQSKAAKEFRDLTAYERPRGANVAMICTNVKFIEITTAYELYQRSFDEHYEAFIYSFLMKNDLLAPASGDHKPTPEENKMAYRALLMSTGIDKVEQHKQIENK